MNLFKGVLQLQAKLDAVPEQKPKPKPFVVEYRLVPKPHGMWALERSEPYCGVGSRVYTTWKEIARYVSVEAAREDLKHLMSEAVINPLDDPVA